MPFLSLSSGYNAKAAGQCVFKKNLNNIYTLLPIYHKYVYLYAITKDKTFICYGY